MQVTSYLPLHQRVEVKGKFFYRGEEKLYIKGVTYGTFAPNGEGHQFPEKAVVENDFDLMLKHGVNCVRTYTPPPQYLLDLAHKLGLYVMVGIPWEQHITFLDNRRGSNLIIERIREAVKFCNQHPAILCYSIGNEIPSNIVRWYGKKRIEHFLKKLYHEVKTIDPDILVTYVNYPTTEYLQLKFLDFDCFNVYLETPQKLGSYISRLHNLSGDRPLMLAEIGLDSLRNGAEMQARTLKWQIEMIFGKGCAGMFVFAWTDEWWRGGYEISDWDFGIVDRHRKPKPALSAVSSVFEDMLLPSKYPCPYISVVVCSFNGSRTIRDCMEGLMRLNYPEYEVIVINDGSTDNLAEIVSEYPVKLITTDNQGLSQARNTGMKHAHGEIIAYIDDDAYPDPHWLNYLAYAYQNGNYAAIGGPNICPVNDGMIALSVANSPGGPAHVLLSDEIAEHIPGCNMSFRKKALLQVGGFDAVFRTAGDDVDICWRIQKSGGTIGFHPSAVVWHHRRNSVKAYWKQQIGYGRAEALLENKWPEKYNSLGHLAWNGRIYGSGLTLPITAKKDKVFHGVWGTAAFQSVYQPTASLLNFITLTPEWYLICVCLGLMASITTGWNFFIMIFSCFILSFSVIIAQAVYSACKVKLPQSVKETSRYRMLIAFLHVVQPVARLYGRLVHGLTIWRKRGANPSAKYLFTSRLVTSLWSETWHAPEYWLEKLEKNLIGLKGRVKRGGNFDRWDVEWKIGLFAKGRGLLTIEEHGGGRQMVKFKCWIRYPEATITILSAIIVSALYFLNEKSSFLFTVTCIILFIFGFIVVREATALMHTICKSFSNLSGEMETEPDAEAVFEKTINGDDFSLKVPLTGTKQLTVIDRSYQSAQQI